MTVANSRFANAEGDLPNVQRQAEPRVLHIVENLDRGAVENWLMRMLAYAHSNGMSLDWTFYCLLGNRGTVEEAARALGARVLHSPVRLKDKFAFVRALRNEIRKGRYDVLHCHHDLVSALYLIAAVGLPVRRRLVHVHNADEGLPTPSLLKQLFYREPMRRICLGLSDRIVGISQHTLDTFLAGGPRTSRDVVHYYGVESGPFEDVAADRATFRSRLSLSSESRILLFAGRLVPEKNPIFAVEVLAALRRVCPSAVGVFMGAGSQERAVSDHARLLGVQESIRMLGWRDDVPQIMSGCDWFILPRPEEPMEGFGLAIVEAQLAGLRLLLSRGIPDDPLLPSAVVRRLALSSGPEAWAGAAMELLALPRPDATVMLRELSQSPMSMSRALRNLLGLYE